MDSVFPEIWLLVIGAFCVLVGGIGFFSDYKFYKKNNWDWEEINPNFSLNYGEMGGPDVMGPGRLWICGAVIVVGCIVLAMFFLIN